MKLITVRHGETENNATGITQGWLDSKLNDKGIEQARKVAERLKNEKIDVIYSSDLKRASRTAEEIVKLQDCELILEERLREQNKGKYNGGPTEDLNRAAKESGENVLDWIPEGGESLNNVKKRVLKFLDEIEKKHTDETVLIVSHGGPMAMISRHIWKDTEYEPEKCEGRNHSHKNTAISEYFFDGKKWKGSKFNCTEHLT
jgi:broad specificity phosphatase PhoE